MPARAAMSETTRPVSPEEYPEIGDRSVDEEVTDSDEEGADADALREPWDPGKIRVDPKTFSLKNVIDMIRDGDLELAPDFQRNQVWKARVKSLLIESILLRIPLPAFYFSGDAEGHLRVIDGQQRLSTVDDFVKGRFPLRYVEWLKELEGKRFQDLAGQWHRRIYQTQIHVNIIDPQTPDRVKFDIFKRINTGGTPLNAQEIRHCMSKQRSRDFLKRLVQTPEFVRATDDSLRDHLRMADRENALRFCAFLRPESVESYSQPMEAFLGAATRALDEASEGELDEIGRLFRRAMDNAASLFGNRAFRKWPAGQADRFNPINRPLFESWSVALANHEWSDLEPRRDAIVGELRRRLAEDRDYDRSLSFGTGDVRRVKLRFDVARVIAREAGK